MENNKYLLSVMVAKRAKELEKGAKPLVETKYRKPMMIALEEIKAGKVFTKEKKEPFKAEDVFHEEESVKPEDLPDKVEKPVKSKSMSNKVKKSVKIEEMLGEVEKPVEIEKIFDEGKESGKSKG